VLNSRSAVAMMACHFSFNLIGQHLVGRLIGRPRSRRVHGGILCLGALSLGDMVEIGLTAVAARRHGKEPSSGRAARRRGRAVAVAAGRGR